MKELSDFNLEQLQNISGDVGWSEDVGWDDSTYNTCPSSAPVTAESNKEAINEVKIKMVQYGPGPVIVKHKDDVIAMGMDYTAVWQYKSPNCPASVTGTIPIDITGHDKYGTDWIMEQNDKPPSNCSTLEHFERTKVSEFSEVSNFKRDTTRFPVSNIIDSHEVKMDWYVSKLTNTANVTAVGNTLNMTFAQQTDKKLKTAIFDLNQVFSSCPGPLVESDGLLTSNNTSYGVVVLDN